MRIGNDHDVRIMTKQVASRHSVALGSLRKRVQ